LPYLRELGVTYLHLMPFLLPRPGDNDGGYAVADYRTVRPDLGTLDNLRDLTAAMRGHGISLVCDLVLNHVAREHGWAQAAREGSEQHRRYFHVFPDRELPDAYERTLPEVFPDFAPGNFTYDPDLQGWVWTTFNSWQWDVDWSNPEVFVEYADLVLFLANLGVEIFRLDAVAFLWKRMGTNCQNQPEVHALTQALRAVARMACPAVAFKAEAIVGPADLVHYLGQGHHHGKVSDLAYHNTLMVQVWSMLAAGDAQLAVQALRALPAAPTTTAWITYVRCHDDIGWAIDDGDAAAVGLSGYAHRAFLSDWYSGEFPGSPARGLVFQYNPATGDRRISGTAGSLTGVESAEGSGDQAALDAAIDRLLLAHAIVYGWGGIPVLWSGDELALVNDAGWAQEEGHEADNRWAHRPRLPQDDVERRRDPSTAAGRVFRPGNPPRPPAPPGGADARPLQRDRLVAALARLAPARARARSRRGRSHRGRRRPG
jgi:amylosucrase